MGLIMPVEPIDNGTGAAVYPYGINNTATQTAGMNPNASWAARTISQYNRPSVTQVDYTDLERATEWNRLILEEQRRDADYRAKVAFAGGIADVPEPTIRENLDINIQKGLLAANANIEERASRTRQSISNAMGAVAGYFTSPNVDDINVPITRGSRPSTDYTPSNGLTNLNSLDTFKSAPERLGFTKQISYGSDGIAIGWSYKTLMEPSLPAIAVETPAAATQLGQNITAMQDQAAARSTALTGPATISDADYYMGARSYMGRRWSNDWNIYEQAAYLRDNREANKRAVAIELYGQPVQTVKDGKVIENWATSGNEYYGLLPGEVPTRIVNPPDKNAPIKEWETYVDKMRYSTAVPLYKTGSARPEIEAMTVSDYKTFQKRLLAAGVYPPNTPISLGIKTEFEDSQMERLMALANRNGMTWSDVLEIQTQAYNEALSSGGLAGTGGGGGGGGGGGNGAPTTYTQTQYSMTSISSARSLLTSVLMNSLGRIPTDDELKRFVQLLNDAESKSPSTVTTTTSYDDNATSSVSTSTPSGVDEQALADQFAQQVGGTEAASYGADNYISGLMQYLGA
jgi:hypothetical protein